MADSSTEPGPGPLITVGGRAIDLSAPARDRSEEPAAGDPPISVELASPSGQRLTRSQGERQRQRQILVLALSLVGVGVMLGLTAAAIWWRRHQVPLS